MGGLQDTQLSNTQTFNHREIVLFLYTFDDLLPDMLYTGNS